MNELLVSVIVAVKNGERYLTSALESISSNDYRPIEILVVDGHSRDKTANIAKSFKLVRYIKQTNLGIADAYNTGVKAAKGHFIAFNSHDDLWTPDKLRTQVSYMLNRPEIEYTVAHVKFFLEPGCSPPGGFRKDLLQNNHPGYIMETLVARSSLFSIIGDFNTSLTTAEDVDWFARTKDADIPMALLPKVLLYKRIHNHNISLNTLENNQNLLVALKRSIDRKRSQRASEPIKKKGS